MKKQNSFCRPTSQQRRAVAADAQAYAVQTVQQMGLSTPPHIIHRDERTMAEAVSDIRTRGPQPPLDYVAREPLYSNPPARRAAVPVLLGIAFLSGLLLGMGL